MKTSILIILAFVMGCATQTIGGLVRLQDRELLIDPDKPSLSFPYKKQVCVSRKNGLRWLGEKCHWEQDFIRHDMNIKSEREKLNSAGFTCKSKMRFKY